MKTIHKFRVDLMPGVQFVEMDEEAHVGHVAPFIHQGVECYIWCEVDPDAPKVRQGFIWIPTGRPIPDYADAWLGTSQTLAGEFFHLFSVGHSCDSTGPNDCPLCEGPE